MGKTALATNIAYHVAKAHAADPQTGDTMDGAVVGFFSLEMSAEQLATRIISEQSQISSEKIRCGRIDLDEFDRIVEVSQEPKTCRCSSTRRAASWPSWRLVLKA